MYYSLYISWATAAKYISATAEVMSGQSVSKPHCYLARVYKYSVPILSPVMHLSVFSPRRGLKGELDSKEIPASGNKIEYLDISLGNSILHLEVLDFFI